MDYRSIHIKTVTDLRQIAKDIQKLQRHSSVMLLKRQNTQVSLQSCLVMY